MAMELDVAIRAVENGALKPPLSTIAGIRTAPSAATVAGPDPEIAPKKQATITHTMAMPPLLCPTQVSTNLTSLLEIPAFAMIFPESTKNGIARRRNLLIPAYILVATMVRRFRSTGLHRRRTVPDRLQWELLRSENKK